jgi:hypothetical protein
VALSQLCLKVTLPPILPIVLRVGSSVWAPEEGLLLQRLQGHTQRVQSVAVYREHVTGRDRIVTASFGRSIR